MGAASLPIDRFCGAFPALVRQPTWPRHTDLASPLRADRRPSGRWAVISGIAPRAAPSVYQRVARGRLTASSETHLDGHAVPANCPTTDDRPRRKFRATDRLTSRFSNLPLAAANALKTTSSRRLLTAGYPASTASLSPFDRYRWRLRFRPRVWPHPSYRLGRSGVSKATAFPTLKPG